MGWAKRPVSDDALLAGARKNAPEVAVEVNVLSDASYFETWFENILVLFFSACTDKTRVVLPHCPYIARGYTTYPASTMVPFQQSTNQSCIAVELDLLLLPCPSADDRYLTRYYWQIGIQFS
jgi:hypothetical protein